jgi:Tol biopolymer transport system component
MTPTITPQPTVGFSFDNWDTVEIPDAVRGGLDGQLVVFINSNDQQNIANIATAQPSTNIQTLYFASPTNPANRIPILELDSSTGNQVWVARPGNALAYFKSTGGNIGLYTVNLENGFSARLVAVNSLVQRGIVTEPVWSPDGNWLAMPLATGYDMDIFIFARDGSSSRNLTQHGAYDFWPQWSPDGRTMAFVSDRAICPSWIPGEKGACDAATDSPLTGGHVYLLDVESGAVTRISKEYVTEPPRWLNNSLLVFAVGDPFDLLNPRRTLWLANTRTGTVGKVQLAGDGDDVLYLSDAWSQDGQDLLVQRVAGNITELVLMTADGQLIRRRDDLTFPQYGMAAAFAPNGARLAIGGVEGQCPYGIRVVDGEFSYVSTGNPPPSMCDPIFSPDGLFVAFTGVNPRVDGRMDVYTANENGFGAVNLTADLRGNVELIGWVGP